MKKIAPMFLLIALISLFAVPPALAQDGKGKGDNHKGQDEKGENEKGDGKDHDGKDGKGDGKDEHAKAFTVTLAPDAGFTLSGPDKVPAGGSATFIATYIIPTKPENVPGFTIWINGVPFVDNKGQNPLIFAITNVTSDITIRVATW